MSQAEYYKNKCMETLDKISEQINQINVDLYRAKLECMTEEELRDEFGIDLYDDFGRRYRNEGGWDKIIETLIDRYQDRNR